MLLRCQPGYEAWLVRETETNGWPVAGSGSAWVRVDLPAGDPDRLERLCFSHAALLEETEVEGESVNQLADRISQYFLETSRQERFEGEWSFWVTTAAGMDGLGRRADAVARAAMETLRKRMARVAKLARAEAPAGPGEHRGLFIFFLDFQRVVLSRRCHFGGQRRMADDPLAPSRSYLKVEEAYGVLGREPTPDESVVDLGAAPGGWSYSAAKRGARVIAVDNGPLKGGALDHPLIEHRREDAFHFVPASGTSFDWMFCDLVEEPHHVWRNIVEPWISRGWCRRFVVILKFGRTDPIALLGDLRVENGVLSRHGRNVRIRHLFHDREEFSIVGEVGV